MKIIVADDDSGARLLLQALITKLGHEVQVARDGVEALRMLSDDPPDLLVTDWNMPGLTGLELCRRVRETQSSNYVYVILVTSRDDLQSYTQGMSAGADDFLSKPVDVSVLASRIRVAERILTMQKDLTRLRSAAVPLCIYCRRLKQGDEWIPAEDYIAHQARGGLADRICPSCYAVHLAGELEKL